jgi:hypothetical protein
MTIIIKTTININIVSKKMKNTNYQTVATIPTFNRIIIETNAKSTPLTNTYHSLPWLGTGTFIKSSWVKLVSRPKISFANEMLYITFW